jgi:hypothetical protein
VSACPEVEQLVREKTFAYILRRFTAEYFGDLALPEACRFQDLFFVKYGVNEGEKSELAVHTDGSAFSFNVLLSSPSSFDGGGTFFEDLDETVCPGRGEAVVHSGDVRHGGKAITRGNRYILVGFIGSESKSYSSKLSRWAGQTAFCKFGRQAFCEVECILGTSTPDPKPPSILSTS